jgi:CHAT domain-containing protein
MSHALFATASGLGLGLALALPSLDTPDPAAPPIARLREGSVLDRDLAAGESHRYEIELRAGQYLQVVVEQHGVDVVETLTGPDGAVVLEADSPCGFIGPDPLAAVVGQTGVYTLALKGDAVPIPPRGRYELRVEAVREPVEDDLLRVKAVQLGAVGARALTRDARDALAPFRAALSAWEAAGDRRMQMWMELEVGFVHGQAFEDYREAEAVLGRALAMALDLEDEWAEARVRYALARSQRSLGQLDEARSNLERSLALHRAAGREEDAAQSLSSLGNFHSLAAEPQAALDALQDALKIYRATGNPRGEATTLNTMGQAYLRLGDPEMALEQFRAAEPALAHEPTYRTRSTGGLEVVQARTKSGTALAYYELGDFARSREAYRDALDIYQTIGNRLLEAEAHLGLGDLEREQGGLEAARKLFEQALATFRARTNPLGEGVTLCRLGEVHRLANEAEPARQAFEAALATAPRSGPLVRACAEVGLSRLSRDAGQLEAALALAESALRTAESARAALAGQGTRAAALALDQSRYELVIDILMRKHEARPLAGHDAAAFDVSERARARSLLELLGDSRSDLRRGIAPELLADERSLRRRLNTAAAAQAEAAGAGRAEKAESLNRELDRLSAQLAEIESRIRRTSPQYAALTQTRPLTLAEVRARVLDSDTQLLQYALGDVGSTLWVVSADRLESFRLAPRTEIEASARRMHELLALPPTSGARETDRAALESARRQLGRLVLEPAAGSLRARRLLIVTPGTLQYVPLGTLPLSDGTTLLSRFEVVSAPSASVIASLRDQRGRRGRAGKEVVVFADPDFERSDPRLAGALAGSTVGSATDISREPLETALRGIRRPGAAGGLSRLPFSRREADAIMAIAPHAVSLSATGFAASREAATSERLADYRIVHFATHGILNTRRPELSGVVLSLFDAQGRRQDGFLRLHDVYNLSLSADLVVLSGCQTGLGKELRGEGLVGLTRGFLYAGSSAVLASLWAVDDESTADLMTRFYRGLLKENRRPADALRTAQLEMSRTQRWSAPFYWAGFVLQGDWRVEPAPSGTTTVPAH